MANSVNLFCDARHSDPAIGVTPHFKLERVQSFVEEPMASLNDRAGVKRSMHSASHLSPLVAFSTDFNRAVLLIASSTLSLISRLTGHLRTWRQREQERTELARMSQAELHDIGVSSSERWAEISKPFWRK
jgi:uncharacterized protein YjiS (DUF1127 family)